MYTTGKHSRYTLQMYTPGIHSRCTLQVYTPGVQYRCTMQVYNTGVQYRYTFQVYTQDAHSRCKPQVYTPGVHSTDVVVSSQDICLPWCRLQENLAWHSQHQNWSPQPLPNQPENRKENHTVIFIREAFL